MLFRYMEKLGICYADAIATPWSEIERAIYIWSLDADRAKLEEERNKPF